MTRTLIQIGCSGYNNAYWKGIFYPEDLPRVKWFEFYCRHFNTYEMNGSFYKFPTTENLAKWHEKAPEGFVFSVKAPKIITHIKKFSDCEKELNDFYTICRNGLKEKLGGVLFQLPPSFDFSGQRLQLIVNALHPGFKNIIEFRHKSWWNAEVFNMLAQHDITFCSVSYPGLPEGIIPNTKTAYLRLHGNLRLFYSEYTEAALQGFRNDLTAADGRFDEIFVYFNNTASQAGILNAMSFKAKML